MFVRISLVAYLAAVAMGAAARAQSFNSGSDITEALKSDDQARQLKALSELQKRGIGASEFIGQVMHVLCDRTKGQDLRTAAARTLSTIGVEDEILVQNLIHLCRTGLEVPAGAAEYTPERLRRFYFRPSEADAREDGEALRRLSLAVLAAVYERNRDERGRLDLVAAGIGIPERAGTSAAEEKAKASAAVRRIIRVQSTIAKDAPPVLNALKKSGNPEVMKVCEMVLKSIAARRR